MLWSSAICYGLLPYVYYVMPSKLSFILNINCNSKMIKYQTIKDKDKLFSKLFISPTFHQENHTQLIVSPHFLALILKEAENIPIDNQKELLLQIMSFFTKQPINSLMVYNHDCMNGEECGIMDCLVMWMYKLLKDEDEIILYGKCIEDLLKFYVIGIKQIEKITQLISLKFHHAKFHCLQIKFLHTVLQIYYSSPKYLQNHPPSYFFLYGQNANSTIHSLEKTQIKLKNELSIAFAFCLLNPASGEQKICEIKTSKQKLVVLLGKKIKIVNTNSKETLESDEQQMQINTWYRILINFSTTETSLYLNAEEIIKDKPLIKKEKERTILEYIFGQEFVGFITGIVAFEKVLPLQKFEYSQFPYSLSKWKCISKIKDRKLQNSIIWSALPFSTFEVRYISHSFDVFRRNHSVIGQNIIIWKDISNECRLNYMGWYTTILPLFYIARFYNNEEYPTHLENLLKIWLSIIENNKDRDKEDAEKNQQFLLIVGYHISSLPHLITIHCIHLFTQIQQKLSHANKVLFMRHVLWGSHLAKIHHPPLLIAYFNLLVKKYQNNKSQALRAFGLMDVMYWAIKHLQNKTSNCCLNHYTSESILVQDYSYGEGELIDERSSVLHYSCIETIGSIIVEYLIVDGEKDAMQQIQDLLRLLLHKYSNCLYSSILNIIKKQIPKFKNDTALINILLTCHLQAYLVALSEKIVDHALISDIVYLLLNNHHFIKDPSFKTQIIQFIINLFKRFKQFFQLKFRFHKCASLKIRKHSADYYLIQNKYSIKTADQKNKFIQKITDQTAYDFQQLKKVLIHYVFQDEAQIYNTHHQNKFMNPQSFQLLFYFMKIIKKQNKMDVLIKIQQKVEESSILNSFSKNSINLHKLLYDILQNNNQEEPLYKKCLRIISLMLQKSMEQKQSIEEYYIFLKCIETNPSTTFSILSKVLIISLSKYQLNLNQLFKILIIIQYEFALRKNTNKKDYMEEHQLIFIEKLHERIYENVSEQYLKTSKISKMSVQTLSPQQLVICLVKKSETERKCCLFDDNFKQIPEEEITFMFDIVLPKIIAEVKFQQIISEETVKKLQNFQLYVYHLFNMISTQKSSQVRNKYVKYLTQNLILYLSVNFIKKQQFINKSHGRMLIYFVSAYLLNQSSYIQKTTEKQINKEKEKQMQKDVYLKAFVQIWKFILTFLSSYALQFQVETYQQLHEMLAKSQIHCCFIQIFHVFFREKYHQETISLKNIKKMTIQQLEALILSKQFKQVILLQKNTLNLLQFCIKKAHKDILESFNIKLQATSQKYQLLDYETQRNSENIFKYIENIFDKESYREEAIRLKYLHEHECVIRKYHSSWQKIWNYLRIYHNSYSFFIPQKNNALVFLFNDNELKNKNFIFKMSKYKTKSGIYPILQAKIVEPWHVKKNHRLQNNKEMNTLVEMMRPNQNYRKKQIKDQNMFSNLTNLWNLMKTTVKYERSEVEVEPQYEVLWINGGKKARGKILLNDNEEIIFWYQNLKQEDSHLSFEKFNLPFNKQTVHAWRIDTIQQIHRRRYLMKYNALEIEFNSTKSILFCFEKDTEAYFIKEIQKIRAEKMQLMTSFKIKLNNIGLFQEGWFHQFGIEAKKTEDWKNHKITSLEYLIAVNTAASRSINDLSQYPVFPWVAQMKQQKQPSLRDLSKTMCGLGSEERKKILRQKYLSKDPFNPVPPFYFGTHYSSPGVIFNYLIRLSPFTQYSKNLQGGKFDIPDRLFSSFVNSWKSAFTQVSDVRQLIPQFYYLPQCLLNSQRYNFGQTQSGQLINNVDLPLWGAQNPYFFTTQLRQILQSEQISEGLSHWIDLIFGYKQKGIEAEQNFNIYYYLTYEEYNHNIEKQEDLVYKKSCQAQIVHFGQIPPILFEKAHPIRNPIANTHLQLKIYLKIQLMNAIVDKLIGVALINNQLIFIKRNQIDILSIHKSPAVLTKNVKFNLEKSKSQIFFTLKRQQAKIIFFKQSSWFIVSGYLNNQFRIYSRSTGLIQHSESLDSSIKASHLNLDENLIFFGCLSGMLHIFQIQYQSSHKLAIKKVHIEAFHCSINHISEYDGFYAFSFGLYVSIYKCQRSLYYMSTKKDVKPFIKFFRSFKNNLLIKTSYILSNPLFAIAIHDNANLKIYSINGQLIKTVSCCGRFVGRLVDNELNDLLYYMEEDRLVLMSTPDLRCISEMEVRGYLQYFENVIVYARELHLIHCI